MSSSMSSAGNLAQSVAERLADQIQVIFLPDSGELNTHQLVQLCQHALFPICEESLFGLVATQSDIFIGMVATHS